MDWSQHYPAFIPSPQTQDAASASPPSTTNGHPPQQPSLIPEFADIGCGFGGLLFALSPLHPQTLILGLEIRSSVTAYVQSKIAALRTQSDPSSTSTPSAYANIACLRANTMKFLPNFFPRAHLRKLFLCFPDPHFKTRKHKARIVSAALAAEYAFVLRPGGKVYTITDVEDLHAWMAGHLAAHALFERVGAAEVEGDACVRVMRRETEEGKKVERNGGSKFVAVFRRVEDPAWP